jgi:hypothetical protein
MNIVFVGETWKGSSARSLREALEGLPGVAINEVDEDLFFPKFRSFFSRICMRMLRRWQLSRFDQAINRNLQQAKAEVLLVYKGSAVSAHRLRQSKLAGVLTVNVFPDNSPHAHGNSLRKAIGEYDLVVSTKSFHPGEWRSVYGYSNRCVFVPHGYDPAVHYWPGAPSKQDIDVVLVATWRAEYHQLMLAFAKLLGEVPLHVRLAGSGWLERKSEFPSAWGFENAVHGREYGKLLRRAKIAIAPVSRNVMIDGGCQPGDEDSTRTYELAAAHCFFLHRRTEYVKTIYDEETEVAMWDTPEELAEKVLEFLPLEDKRRAMAARAHLRAVPDYSVPARAVEVVDHIAGILEQRRKDADGTH